jgi:hypothetical protein
LSHPVLSITFLLNRTNKHNKYKKNQLLCYNHALRVMKYCFLSYLWLLLAALVLFSCKSAKLSDAEEKHRIGEYYEAAAIYRKVYTKTKPQNRDLRGYIAFRMAECNRIINNTPRASSAYMNAIRYNYPDSIAILRLAKCFIKQVNMGMLSSNTKHS